MTEYFSIGNRDADSQRSDFIDIAWPVIQNELLPASAIIEIQDFFRSHHLKQAAHSLRKAAVETVQHLRAQSETLQGTIKKLDELFRPGHTRQLAATARSHPGHVTQTIYNIDTDNVLETRALPENNDHRPRRRVRDFFTRALRRT